MSTDLTCDSTGVERERKIKRKRHTCKFVTVVFFADLEFSNYKKHPESMKCYYHGSRTDYQPFFFCAIISGNGAGYPVTGPNYHLVTLFPVIISVFLNINGNRH